MICLQIFTWFWKKALSICTDSLCHLLLAGRVTEICRRPSHIMDITLKIRLSGKFLCLFQNRFLTSGLDNPSMMKGQGAEITAPEAAPVTGNAEPDLFDSRTFSLFLVHRVIG